MKGGTGSVPWRTSRGRALELSWIDILSAPVLRARAPPPSGRRACLIRPTRFAIPTQEGLVRPLNTAAALAASEPGRAESAS